MDLEEMNELRGRSDAVLIALREFFAELGREAPLRKRVRNALIENENEMARRNPAGDWLHGLREARRDMGL